GPDHLRTVEANVPALDKLGHAKLPRRPDWNTPVRDDPALCELGGVLRSTRGVVLRIEEPTEAIHIATRKRRTHSPPAPGQEALCAPALGAPPRPTTGRAAAPYSIEAVSRAHLSAHPASGPRAANSSWPGGVNT